MTKMLQPFKHMVVSSFNNNVHQGDSVKCPVTTLPTVQTHTAAHSMDVVLHVMRRGAYLGLCRLSSQRPRGRKCLKHCYSQLVLPRRRSVSVVFSD